ncbi:Ig-like domain repeat protein [Paenibacillus whitsoniae]|uniref:DUF5011 domain-containing protein n=1 Tax=Paenibacillus whitsoniae TaxID=2496558 RepID=A0A3S0C7M0_9BACL|nr:Ig-like domain repeat protein [Paenibacillus whitsoniae]RTE05011.1 DUF5011 domain-containing protein [Paenibacillus whitsoniae]
MRKLASFLVALMLFMGISQPAQADIIIAFKELVPTPPVNQPINVQVLPMRLDPNTGRNFVKEDDLLWVNVQFEGSGAACQRDSIVYAESVGQTTSPINLTIPASGSQITGYPAMFSYKVKASDPSGRLLMKQGPELCYSGKTQNVWHSSSNYHASFTDSTWLDNVSYFKSLFTQEVYIDTSAPVITFSQSANTNFKDSHGVTINVTDLPVLDNNVSQYYAWTTNAAPPAAADIKTAFTSGAVIPDPVENGTFYLHARAVDWVGHETISTAGPFNYDHIAPKITFGPYTGAIIKQSHGITVTATDEPTNTNVRLYYTWTQSISQPSPDAITTEMMNGAPALDPTGTGVFFLHVKAVDGAGNVTVASSGQVFYDHQGPAVTITPNSGAASTSRSIAYIITDTFAGFKQMSYEWLKDGASYSTGTTSSSSGSLNVPNSLEGNYRLKVTATDNAGNATIVTTQDYVIDKSPPVVTFSSQGNAAPAGARQVNVSLTDAQGTLGEASYLWTNSSTTPAANAGWTVFYTGGTTATYSKQIGSPTGANGTMFLHIKAADKAGNIGYTSTTQGFVLDNTKPVLSFTTPSTSKYVSSLETSLNITDNITNSLANFVIKYVVTQQKTTPADGAAWSSSTNGTFSLSGLNGEYYIYTKVSDQAGNQQTLTGGPYYMDSTPPTGSLTVKTKQVKTNSVEVGLTAADEHGPLDMRLSVNGGSTWGSWEPYADTKTVTIAGTEGTQTIAVQFRDAAGNMSVIYKDTAIYDVTKPALVKITYSTTANTNQPVKATLSATDNYTAAGDIVVSGLNGFTYEFQTNGTYTFVFRDKAGNENTATATVTWIDKTKPAITLSVDGSTTKQKAVSTVISATDNVTASDQLTYAYAWSTSATTAPATWQTLPADHKASLSGTDGIWYLWAKVTDQAGNTATRVSGLFQLDNTSPVGMITYSPAGRTANNVTATLTTNEQVRITQPASGAKEFIFTDNGTFEFRFEDLAGNVGTATAVVNNIDRSLPSAQVTISPTDWTKGPVQVTVDTGGNTELTLSDFVVPEDAVSMESTVSKAVYTFATNGTIRYRVTNQTTGIMSEDEVDVRNIDLVPPTGELIYSEARPTNQDVTVTLVTYDENHEAVTIVNNGGSDTYTFTKNGTFTFVFADQAGNLSQMTATVSNIVKQLPQAVITYSETGWTKQDVQATLAFPGAVLPMTILNNEGSAKVTFTQNGTFTFYYRDEAGNEGEAMAQVTNIDREPPKAVITYNVTGWTNQNVVATIVAVDNSGVAPVIVNNQGNPTYTFTDNGEFTFVFRDEAGNQQELRAYVDRIDKQKPVATIRYSTSVPTNADVRASVDANEAITVLGNNGNSFYDFTVNGSYTFVVADRAGNQSTVTATVANIDRTPPSLHLTYSTTAPTKDAVYVTVGANEEIQVLNNNRAKQMVFRDNGTFTFLVQDLAGNRAEAVATVTNISLPNAKVTYSYSETGPTRNDVTVTLNAEQPLTYAGISGNKVTFTENGTRWIEATDAVSNKYVFRVDVTNIDRTAPSIRFLDGDQLLLPVGSPTGDLKQYVEAVDNLDGNVKDKLSVTHTIQNQVPGEYKVTYSVKDRAGNEAVVVRKAIVIAPTEFTVYVNGNSVQNGDVVVYGQAIKLSLFGQQGDTQVQWSRGSKAKGDFKTFQAAVTNGMLEIKDYGLYTFYVQDQERQTKLIHVYILPAKTTD